MAALRVLEAWSLATVQDLGRRGSAALGVPPSGAADALSLAVGNRLVGNAEGAPAIEWTLRGGAVSFDADALVALAGAPMAASVVGHDGTARAAAPWEAFRIGAGETLRIGTAPWGARAYLCVAGGIAVPAVLGSASTNLRAGFGGHEGRALRAGDRLAVGTATPGARPRALGPEAVAAVEARLCRPTVRATQGPHAEAMGPAAAAAFWGRPWTVTDASDRMGVRLDGPPVPGGSGSMTTEGMAHGAVQVPADGRPIVLLCDRPTTGGYAVLACVATVDLPRLGQWRPREAVAFERVTVEEARAAADAERRALERRIDGLAGPSGPPVGLPA